MVDRIDRRAHGRRGWIRDLAALTFLLVLTLLFFWRILTPHLDDRGSFRRGDFYDQFYAFAAFEFSQLSQGQLPLWNPYTFAGHPFLADVQSAVFYPPSLLTMLLSSIWGFSAFALELEAIAHVFLAGAFTYLFSKRLLGHRPGALVAAITFAFGGYLASYPPLQLAILETVVWLPLILLLLDLATETLGPGRRRWGILYLLLAGSVLGIAILAGHPQSGMYVVYVSALYFVYRTWLSRRRDPGRLSRRCVVGGLGLFVLSGLSLAAVQILPSWEYMHLSTRSELGYEELATGFSYLDLLQILLPRSTGFWSPLYIGILALLLALFALAVLVLGRAPANGGAGRRQWRADVTFWASLAAVSLLLSLGGESFLYSLFYLLAPGFGLFRAQERAALIFSFALSLLAGYGFSTLLDGLPGPVAIKDRHRAFLIPAVSLGVGVVGMVALLFYGQSIPGSPPGGLIDSMLGVGIFVVLLLAGSLIWLLVVRQQPEKRWLAAGLALCLLVFDLFTVNARPNVQSRPVENQYPANDTIRRLQAEPAPFRVYDEFRLPGNYGCVFGIEDMWGASPLYLANYKRFVDQVPQERVWQLLNVDYVVTWLDELAVPATVIHEEPVKKGEVTYLHRLDAEHPRVWTVYDTEVFASEEETLDRLAQPDFDPYRTALLAEPPMAELPGQMASEGHAQLVEFGPTHLAVEVDQTANGLLVLSEIDYPGWRAWLDGRPVPILKADAILRAVEVPAGQHRVEMAFRPRSVFVGLAISATALVLGLTYIVWILLTHVGKANRR